MKKQLTTLVAALVMTGAVQAAGDAEAGKAKSATCVACHGMDGNSLNPIWPSLAGQHASYIQKQLSEFKSGNRKDPLMSPMATPLTDADLPDLAAFFSSQKRKMGTAAPESVKRGEMLYRAGDAKSGITACTGCHAPNGTGNSAANFPNLNGQMAAYVEKALKDFRAGTRTTDPNGMMRNIAANMSDADIAATAQYVQGLR